MEREGVVVMRLWAPPKAPHYYGRVWFGYQHGWLAYKGAGSFRSGYGDTLAVRLDAWLSRA